MTLKILIAPAGFKESLDAEEVANCIETGILLALPDAKILKVPLVDGGEGFTKALVAATGGTLHQAAVTGPLGRPVEACYGFLGGTGPKTAVLDIASAAGLRLISPKDRDPLVTTTYGVGELIRIVLDSGPKRILIGCGDSGTNDGGVGMAAALGVGFLDANGQNLGWGGGELARLEHIDMNGRDRRLDAVEIDAACNWQNIFCGPNGVSRVYGAQKGASPDKVEQLADAMERLAAVIARELKIDVREMPAGGASGGLGAGLHAFLGARLHPRYEIITHYFEVEGFMQEADIVFTAEGAIDEQTPRGKIPSEVARRAKRYHLPVIALAGTVGENARVNLNCGIDSYTSILNGPCTLADAIKSPSEMLVDTTEQVMRTVMVGVKLQMTDRQT
ncbi:MAG: glycerate kinase [Deltaproteobacteria bacterium]|nr:glycerate kinase [Deltaproteobacteria bacterium]MBW2482282.1 glycerate kinase [Deltaproteobacteria bacterium]